mmetsp:Transcript_38416/g.59773  ORF Transcript_38416/g.59773 Transcript_38416/m.59773 type:complete len:168 (+) Transcript_38416:37-540(+)
MTRASSIVMKIGDPTMELPTLLTAERTRPSANDCLDEASKLKGEMGTCKMSPLAAEEKRASAKKTLDEITKLMDEMSADVQFVADMVEERKHRNTDIMDSKANKHQDDELREVTWQPRSCSNSSLSGMIKAGMEGVASAAKSPKSSERSQASDQSESFMKIKHIIEL